MQAGADRCGQSLRWMKAGSRPQYYRIRRMVQMVREGAETGYLPNSSDFMQEFEVSRRTVARDLDFLRDEERAPLAYDDAGIVAWRPLRDENGAPDSRDIAIVHNVFDTGKPGRIRINGVDGLRWEGNRLGDGAEELDASSVSISDCTMRTDQH